MVRILFTAFLAAAVAAPSLAQEISEPHFLIERIEVRNAERVPPHRVISETRLHEGVEYSEQQLSTAASRLSRLPFLLSADFSLEKGSDRGRYVLVITIAETKPLFFLLDARPIIREEIVGSVVEFADHPEAESRDAALGFRWFVGERGIIHLGATSRHDRHSFTADYSAAALGFTQYDLFGSRGFVTVNLRLPFDSPAEGLISPQVVMGVPLTTNQTITFDFEDNRFRKDTQEIQGVRLERQDAERLLSLSWTYNTTNQPFVPTRGTIVRISPLLTMRDRKLSRFFPLEEVTQHVRAHGVDFVATQFWELSERNAVSAGILTGWATVENRVQSALRRSVQTWDPTYLVLRGGYSRSFWRGDPRSGDSRLELEARVSASQLNFNDRLEFEQDEEDVLQLTASWVRRSSWGALRLGVGFGWEQ